MQLVSYLQIKQFIPKDSCYYSDENSYYQHEYDDKNVWFHDGDYEFSDPLNLDLVDQIYSPSELPDYSPFMLINGSASFGNIFNWETDGSAGLVVLGNLSVENMVVGGQEIYVDGDLEVKDLFWGDYNHGHLTVNGKITSRVFLNTDYGFDHERFKKGDNIAIEHLLTDEQEDLYIEGDYLKALFNEKFIFNPEEIDDDIYSWKQWLKEWLILEALEKREPVLSTSWNVDFLPKEAPVPAFFSDNEISERNLLRLGESNILKSFSDDGLEALQVEYWDDLVFRRVYQLKENPLSTSVYVQYDHEFSCMVYMGQKKTLLGQAKYIFSKAYRILPDGDWSVLNDTAPAKYRDFLETQWKILLEQYTRMHHWWNTFKSTVTPEKISHILDLPLVLEKHGDYYNDDNALFYGAFQWDFRLSGNAKGYCPRISINKSNDDFFEFYHINLAENNTVELLEQSEDGYESEVYEIPVYDFEKIRNAIRYFKKLEKNIYRLNEHYLKEKDVEIDHEEWIKPNLTVLSMLCLHESYRAVIENYVQTLSKQASEEGFDVLEELIFYCEENDIPFICRLDWKAEIYDLEAYINQCLRENFKTEVDIPSSSKFPAEFTISAENVLKKFDFALRQQGFRLGLIRTDTDAYWILVHRVQDHLVIDQVLKQIGYEFEEIEFDENWEKYPPLPDVHELLARTKRELTELAQLLSAPQFLPQIESEINKIDTHDLPYALSRVSYQLQEKGISFVLHIERRMPVLRFKELLSDYLSQHFNIRTQLPDASEFLPKAIVTHQNVLMRFEESLLQHGLKLGIIDLDNRTTLYLFAHHITDSDKIRQLMQSLALSYLEVSGSL